MKDGTLLVGDAGGTNVRFALARLTGGRVALSDIWKRPGKDFNTFEAALDAYLKEIVVSQRAAEDQLRPFAGHAQ